MRQSESDSVTNKKNDRRAFLFQSAASLFTLSNLSVYAIGSAFKKLDGSLVAGAKMGNWVMVNQEVSTEACIDLRFIRITNPPTGPCEIGSTAHSTNTDRDLHHGGYCKLTEKDFECR